MNTPPFDRDEASRFAAWKQNKQQPQASTLQQAKTAAGIAPQQHLQQPTIDTRTEAERFASWKQDKQKQSIQNHENTWKDKLTPYIPDFAEGFTLGGVKGLSEYGASGAKLLGSDKWQDKFSNVRRFADQQIKKDDSEIGAFVGEMIVDPLNLAPSGLVNVGTKMQRVGKSMLYGAGVGATTMAAKNYGNDDITTDQKIFEMGVGGAFNSLINGVIAGVTKGRVAGIDPNVLKNPDGTQKSNEEVFSALRNNPEAFALNPQEAEVIVNEVAKEQAKFTQPKVAPFAQNAVMSKQEALQVILRHANEQARAKGGVPPYPQAEVKPIMQPQAEVNALSELQSHPRYNELVEMRRGVSAAESQNPQFMTTRGGYRELDGFGGENKHAYDFPHYEKNPNYDFHTTKQDVVNLERGKVDDSTLWKIKQDLDTLDNHPDWAKRLDDSPVQMGAKDWEEANTVFAKFGDNLAAGVVAGIGEDENGNLTFDPEKFLIGLGGYTAVKAALKNKQVQGRLKEYAQRAIYEIDYGVSRKANFGRMITGQQNLFVGADANYAGNFSDVATKKSMREIDDSNALWSIGALKNGSAKLSDVLDHKELYEQYPELKNINVEVNPKMEPRGQFIETDGGNYIVVRDATDVRTILHELQHVIQKKHGWATGGNPEMFEKTKLEMKREDWASIALSSVEKQDDKSIKAFAREIMNDITKNIDNQEYDSLDVGVFREILQSEDSAKLIKEWNEKSKIPINPYESYRSLHGEQQARAAAYRSGMSKEERASESMWDTLKREEGEVPESIVKYGNGTAMMADELSSRYIKKNMIDEKALSLDADELPSPISNYKDFISNFSESHESKGTYFVKTPIGNVKVNTRYAFNHLTDNTHFDDRNYISGAFVDTLKNPLFVVEKKHSKGVNQVFYKPYKQNGKLTHLASFTVDNDGLVQKTFFELGNLGKLKSLINVPNKDMKYFKHSQEIKSLDTQQQELWKSANEEIIPQTKEEWNKNLMEWHKESHPLTKNEDGSPRVFYHGTGADFSEFKQNNRGVFFVSPSSKWVDDFIGKDGGTSIMPVHIKASNPFDFDNKKHVTALAQHASLGKLAIDEIKKGNWNRIEDRTTLEAIKKLGFDGVFVKENGTKNLAVFDPTQIKSIHNRGTFDTANPNILMANGSNALGGSLGGGTVGGMQTAYEDIVEGKDRTAEDYLRNIAIGAAAGGAIGRKFGGKAEGTGLFAGARAKGYDAKAQAGKTFQGKYDGIERFEINDSMAKLKDISGYARTGETAKLSDVLEHKELFYNYPELKDIPIAFKDEKGSSFSSDGIEIGLRDYHNADEFKSALLHEVQHSIQKQEGFARGGSAQEFYNDAKSKIETLKYELEFEPDDFIRDKMLQKLQKLESEFNGGAKEKAFDMYQKLAGEIEARDVQARMDYTAPKREEVAPYSSENIAPEDAILRFNNANDEIMSGLRQMNQETDDFVGGQKRGLFDNNTDTLERLAKERAEKDWRSISQDGGTLQNVKNTFKELFTDTMSGKYHEARDQVHANMQQKSVEIERLAKVLDDLDEATDKELYRYLTGEENNLPEHVKDVADNMRKTVDDLGAELVRHGVLDEKPYKEWAGVYLHRQYEPHLNPKGHFTKGLKIDKIHERGIGKEFGAGDLKEMTGWLHKQGFLDDNELVKFGSVRDLMAHLHEGGKSGLLREGKLSITQTPSGGIKFRRDFTKAEREAMGEIESAKMALPNTLLKLNRMIEHAKFLERANHVEGVVFSPKKAKEFSPQELERAGYYKAEGVQYGALNGKWIRRDVADDIGRTYKDIANAHKDAFRLWNEYHSLWKKSKTVWNPTAHLNNYNGNLFLMHLAGIDGTKLPAILAKGVKQMNDYKAFEALELKRLKGTLTGAEESKQYIELKAKTKLIQEAKANGVFGRSQLNDILAGMEQKAVKKGVLSKVDKFAEKAYQFEDDFNRLSFYLTLRQAGKDPKTAKQMIDFMLPDYSKPLPKGWRFMRDSSVAPFISWSYYTMPAIVKMLKTKEGAWNATKVIAMLSGMEYALSQGEITPLDNIPFMDTNKPEDFKGRRFVVGKDGDDYDTLKLDRMIPYAELQNIPNFVSSQFSGMVPNVFYSRNGLQMYNGRPITYKNKDAGDQSIDWIKHLASQYTPVPAPAMSAINIADKEMRGKERSRTSRTIEPRTLPQSLVQLLGINTLTYDKNALKKEQKD